MGPTRARVLQTLRDAPGASTTIIARAVDADASTVDYHLRMLTREGFAARERVGREAVWFARSCRFCPLLRRAVPVFRRAGVADVARALGPVGKSAVALSEETGVPVGSVRWIAATLQDLGVGERTRSGRTAVRAGAETCIAKAASASACDLWGMCGVSRALGARPAPSRARR